MQSSGSIGLCLGWQTRPLCVASYAISVRQTGSLPVAALHSLHIRLPSDSTSRWTPLPSANSSYCQVCSGLSPPSYCPCRAHHTKRTAILRKSKLRFFSLYYCYPGAAHTTSISTQRQSSTGQPHARVFAPTSRADSRRRRFFA